MYVVESLKYPLRDVKALVIGSVVMVFSMLVIPAFFLQGYLLRIMASTVRREDSIPKWEKWGDLFKKGLAYLAINLVYVIALMAVMFPLVFGGSLLFSMLDLKNLYSLILIPVGIVIGIPAAIFMQIAPIRYAETGRVGAAFEFRKIYGNLRRGFKYYVLDSLGIWLALFVLWVAVILLSMVLIGLLFFPFLYYYTYAVQTRLYASIYAKHM